MSAYASQQIVIKNELIDEMDENICKEISEIVKNAWDDKFLSAEKKENVKKNLIKSF